MKQGAKEGKNKHLLEDTFSKLLRMLLGETNQHVRVHIGHAVHPDHAQTLWTTKRGKFSKDACQSRDLDGQTCLTADVKTVLSG